MCSSDLDDATWTDAMPSDSRGAMANLTERRGVITVDFSAQGSHSTLSHWDPVRKRLVPASVLESEEEALGHK